MAEQVVELKEIDAQIVCITLQDRINKNTFSDELIAGLIDAFETISTRDRYKVVILTGYDSYFASGGTKEGLLYLSDGKGKFTDRNIYSLALECPLPVISAMQGHGIGGGFVLGLFADFVILSRESIYTTNFMKYGFTPGMGSTYILPKKLGLGLAQEMMFMAGTYYGADLQKRGIAFPVLPREQVMPHAVEVAKILAEKPRLSLITLKDHLVGALRAELPEVIDKEITMHNLTFNQPEVRERIQTLFGN